MSLLLFLYFLQGIPMGLASSVPMFLAGKGASFSDQAVFSLASWPYSLKLLWAPIVDALWTPRMRLGHRKSWVVPVQILTGVVMVALGSRIESFFGGSGPEAAANGSSNTGGGDGSGSATTSSGGNDLDVNGLLACFFLLYFLVATQDIAVDGWALTMLRPENVGYASTANTIGQSVGIMTSYSLFMALDSADVCNRYIRLPLGLDAQPKGLVTMGGFMTFWGCIFILSTFVVWVAKSEKHPAVAAAEAAAAAASAASSSSTSSSAASSISRRPSVAPPMEHLQQQQQQVSRSGIGARGYLHQPGIDGASTSVAPSRTTRSGSSSRRGHAREAGSGDLELQPVASSVVTAAVVTFPVGSSSRRARSRSRSNPTISNGAANNANNSNDEDATSNGGGQVRRRSGGRRSGRLAAAAGGSSSGSSTAGSTADAGAGNGIVNGLHEAPSPAAPSNVNNKHKDSDADLTHQEDGDGDADGRENQGLLQSTSSSAAPGAAAPGAPSAASSSRLTVPAHMMDTDADAGGAIEALKTTYRDFWSILTLRPVLGLVVVMVTIKAGFQATDRATFLVAQGRGIPKESLAMLDMISFPFQLIIQVALSNSTAGPRPLSLVLNAFPFRAAFGLVYLWLIYFALPDRHAQPWSPSDVPWTALALIFIVSNLHSIAQTVMFMGQMSFFSRVSRLTPSIGGSYITLLNTVTNLGSMWPGPLTLKLIDDLTQRRCEYNPIVATKHEPFIPPWSPSSSGGGNSTLADLAASLSCKGAAAESACAAIGGSCATIEGADGYFTMVLVGMAYCGLWYVLMRRHVNRLQDLPEEAWRAKLSSATGRRQEIANQ